MDFDEVHEAVNEAKNTIRMADTAVGKMASIVAGRLRKAEVPWGVLKALKNELRDYNIHTGKWRKK